MELGLTGKVAMVAAASKGIGRAVALALAREGAHVSICARSPEGLQAAQKELHGAANGAKGLAVVCDVSVPEELARWHGETVEELGAPAVLVTNTGGPPAATFLELTTEQWEAGIRSTLMNVVHLTRLVVPAMRGAKWGRLVHLTSLVAKNPSPELTISSTLRAGLSALTKTQAQEFAPLGITVNAVLPGHVDTDRQTALNRRLAEKRGIPLADQVTRVRREIPMGRLGRPEEIGDVVAFLCSERASYVTGASVQVDGGIIASTF